MHDQHTQMYVHIKFNQIMSICCKPFRRISVHNVDTRLLKAHSPPLRDSLRPRAHRLPLEQHNRSDTNIRLELQTAIVCCRHMSADDTSFSPQHTQPSLFSPFPSACLFPYASISFVYLRGCESLSFRYLPLSLTHSVNQ